MTMGVKKKPWEVAFAEALGELASLLRRHGVSFAEAQEDAAEYLRGLQRAGWRHTMPDRDSILDLPDPGTRVPGDVAAEVVPEYGAAREALAREVDR